MSHLITIIVPIYNAQNTLKKCIDSILEQTYPNFELILINDGSTDNTKNICNSYAEADKRIKVLQQKNKGVSAARNLGLNYTRSEWVCFIDSDDWISKDYLKNLISHAQGHDLVISYAHVIYKDRVEIEKYPTFSVKKGTYERLFITNALDWHTSPWSKLFKTTIIKENNIQFPEQMPIGEDAHFLYEYILHCAKIFVSNDTDYFYNAENDGTLTKKIYSIQTEQETLNRIFDITNQLIQEENICNNIALSNINRLKCSYIIRLINSLYYNKSSKKERLKIYNNIDLGPYKVHLHEKEKKTLKEYFIYILLKNKLFWVYDVLCLFRKKWNIQP